MTNSLRNIEDVIYHEFGHVLVYCLANRNKETFLSKIFQIVLGTRNRVQPKENLFYLTQSEDNHHIKENSRNVKKALCWVILQFSGCLFECYYNNTNFEGCFCGTYECSGKKDFDNLYNFNSEANFSILKEDLIRLKSNFIKLLEAHNVFEKIKLYLYKFIKENGNNEDFLIYEECLESFLFDFENDIISNELQSDFDKLINIESKFFNINVNYEKLS